MTNAEAGGASGVILFDQGLANNFAIPNFDLGDGYAGTIPVLASSFGFGEFWAGINGLTMTIQTKLFRGSRSEALVRYCVANSDQCALSVRYIDGGWERHLNPNRPQVTASTYKPLNLIAYAEAVVSGNLNPNQLVTKEEWARFSVRRDGGALANVWTRLGQPDQVTVDQMMRGMMRESDNAAPDWLLNELGAAALESVVAQYVDGFHDVPIAINAFFQLIFGTTAEPDSAARILDQYAGLEDAGYRQELADLLNGPMQQEAWMQAQRQFGCVALPWEIPPQPCTSQSPSTATQLRALLGGYFTRTTSRTMLELMTALLARELLTPNVQSVVEPHLEWFMAEPGFADLFTRYGGKGGSFGPQNICNWAGYAQGLGGDRVVVSVYVQNSLHACNVGLFPTRFMQALALDPDFRDLVRDEPALDLIFKDNFDTPAVH